MEIRDIDRVEVIDSNGRQYVIWQQGLKVRCQLQDDGNTVKIFVENVDYKNKKKRSFQGRI